jgi:hypothetical protein
MATNTPKVPLDESSDGHVLSMRQDVHRSLGRPQARHGLGHIDVVGFCRSLVGKGVYGNGTMLRIDPAPSGVSLPVAVQAARELLDWELRAVAETPLSEEFLHWVHRWCRRGIELTTLSCARDDLRAEVAETKLLGVMLDVLLDDVADFQRDHRFLENLLGLLAGSTSLSAFEGEKLRYAQFTKYVWEAILGGARRLPCYAAYRDLFEYDYLQLFNTMRYASLIGRRLALINLAEHEVYCPHNMHMMIFSTLDLMCSPQVDASELGRIREAAWHSQCMGQIGNQITTWMRELSEGDFTSGVFARAVTSGDLAVEDLARGDQRMIAAAVRRGRHEHYFFDRWFLHRRELLALAPRVHSVDVELLVDGLDRLMLIELGSRGTR